MPRADYYILADSDYDSREIFACRLCEKAISQGLTVQIYVQTETDLNQLNQRLWSFRADSFIPHTILNSDLDAPVRLTCQSDQISDSDILINLGSEPPLSATKFQRVAEIVNEDPEVLTATRKSYQERRSLGWELHRHDQR